jgi:hypothetical protein
MELPLSFGMERRSVLVRFSVDSRHEIVGVKTTKWLSFERKWYGRVASGRPTGRQQLSMKWRYKKIGGSQ